MASKRLDKLRQWAGEVISSKDKTVVTDEFKDLENDIELRRKGIVRLQQASGNYHHFLSKKKDLEILPDEADKISPRDALGIVMISHGEEFGDDSAFGTSLVKFGQGMCKVATLQETHALTLQSTFLLSLKIYLDEIKEYQEQRKKLESRRLSYDAALSKLERLKNSKKEKDRQEAEEEMGTAKSKYEDTSQDVRARMHAIQEEEIIQLRELTNFLDMEIRYAENYLEVMKGVRADWIDESDFERVKKASSKSPHPFPSRSVPDPKFNSIRSHKSSKSQVIDSSDEETMETVRSSRRKSAGSRRKSETERPSSRPPSRTSRKRSDSAVTVGEKETADKARKMSVTGWASSAVNSMTGRGKKDKDNFIGLRDREGETDENVDVAVEDNTPPLRSKPSKTKINSKRSTPTGSPSIPVRILKTSFHTSSSSSLQEKKIVRALYDFSGSSDELSFKVGDEILLLNEVIEGWWMGELEGKRGLFPTTYTEVIATPSPSIKATPPIPQRLGRWGRSFGGPTPSDEDEQSKKTLFGGEDDTTSASLASDDDEHPFGDHNHPIANSRSPTYGTFDATVDSATEEDEERSVLKSRRDSLSNDEPDKISLPLLARDPSFGKKAPPPPPPRRTQISSNGAAPPPLPDRRPNIRSRSTSAAAKATSPIITHTSSNLELSPFDSPIRSQFPTEVKRNPFTSDRM